MLPPLRSPSERLIAYILEELCENRFIFHFFFLFRGELSEREKEQGERELSEREKREERLATNNDHFINKTFFFYLHDRVHSILYKTHQAHHYFYFHLPHSDTPFLLSDGDLYIYTPFFLFHTDQ